MKSNMSLIYVAGAIDGPNATMVFQNVVTGIRTASKLLRTGYAPICPHLDFLYRFTEQYGRAHQQEQNIYYRMGLRLVEAADAVLVCPNSENSKGTKMEIDHAREMGVPVLYSFAELGQWEKNRQMISLTGGVK